MTTPNPIPNPADDDRDNDAEVIDFPRDRVPDDAPADDVQAADDTPDLDDAAPEDPDTAVQVDQADDTGPGRLESMLAARRRPILAEWAKTGDDLKRSAGFVAGHGWHVTRYHCVRTPWYAGRLALRSPRGFGRSVRRLIDWTTDAEGRGLRVDAVNRNDVREYQALSRQRDQRVKSRALLTVPLAAGAVAGAASLTMLPGVEQYPALAAVVGMFGMLGAPADSPLITRAVVKPEYTKLTSDVVLRALGSIGIPALTQAVAKGGRGLAFVAPIAMDGPGWRAELDLPFGVTATDVMDKRTELASGLRRPLGCVWPEPVLDEHSGRLVIWVGKHDMRNAAPVPWPLLKGGAHDIFKPLPFGTDQRGRIVTVLLPENNELVGALPGGGKSYSIQPLVYGAALDPTVQVWMINLKGDGFHKNTQAFAHRYLDGINDETIRQTLEALRELKAEVIRRTTVFKKLSPALNPHGKINRAICDRKSLNLPFLLCAIDEVQNLFAHKTYGGEAGELAEFIIKVGRSLGVNLLLATQRPDKDSVPTGVSANVSVRFCLRVMGQTENDMILGTSAYKNGIRATLFTVKDKGIGYLVGASEEPTIVRSFFMEDKDTARVAAHARALREQIGNLTGYAAGDTDQADTAAAARTVIDDIGDVFGAIPFTSDKVRGEELLTILAEHKPDAYAGWDVKTLTLALKPFGVEAIDVGRREGGKAKTARGYTRESLTLAVTKRHRDGEAA